MARCGTQPWVTGNESVNQLFSLRSPPLPHLCDPCLERSLCPLSPLALWWWAEVSAAPSSVCSPELSLLRGTATESRQGPVRVALPRQHPQASGRIRAVPPGPGPFSCCCGSQCGRQGGLDPRASQSGPGTPAQHPLPSLQLPSSVCIVCGGGGGSYLPSDCRLEVFVCSGHSGWC